MAQLRLLLCRDCRTTEVIPDYEGNPADDATLTYAVEKHSYPNGERHFGRLFRGDINEDMWGVEETRKEILKKVWQEEGYTGMEPWVYDTFETLKSDAMQCWKARLRPSTCSDYRSDKKRLVPPTAADRKGEGMGKYRASAKHQQFLCNYCPINSVVEQKVRKARGLYG